MFDILIVLAVAFPGAPNGCLVPDDSVPANFRNLEAGEVCRKPRPAPTKPPAVVIPTTKQALIKAHFDNVLLDGLTARWKWQLQRHPQVYCGWVNGKNRLGAYSGWKPYYVVFGKSGKVEQGEIVGDGDNTIMLDAFCNSWGYNIVSPQ